MRRLPFVVTALAILCSASSASQAGELTLSVKVIKQDIPVIVGEVIGEIVSLEVTVRNGSNEVQRIPTLAKAIRHDVLVAAYSMRAERFYRPSAVEPYCSHPNP